MAVYANKEAKGFWKRCTVTSRSLASSHFVSLAKDKKDNAWRKQAVSGIVNGKSLGAKAESQTKFSEQLGELGAAVIFGKLEARMILNSSTSLADNAGLSLDRNSGIPFIPGSAVKGVARRYAIWLLSQTDALEKATLLAQIAQVFGYGNLEWEAGRDKKKGHTLSDFWLAMVPLEDAGSDFDKKRNEIWDKVMPEAQKVILHQLRPETATQANFPNLAGSIAFLPSYPTGDPGIEEDILTPHHSDYYSGKAPLALDNEQPNPVIFPVIKKGASFRFTLMPLQHAKANQELLGLAKSWLLEGIQMFGIGSKTNAGYGWFSIDSDAQGRAETEQKRLNQAGASSEIDSDAQGRAETERQAKQDALKREEALANMSEEDREASIMTELPHEEFVAICKNIEGEDKTKQQVVCSMLKNSKKEDWKKWRKQKKGDWPNHVPKIRAIAKTFNIELT